MEQLRPLLDEYHQGKRNDADGLAIMHRMLLYCGFLGSSTTVDCQSLLKEWQALREKHPEYKKQPPIYVREEIEAQAARKKHWQEIAEKAKTFVPSDSRVEHIYGNDHKAVFLYQYHLEFYELPPNLSFRPEPPPNSFFATLYNEDKPLKGVFSGEVAVSQLGLKHLKTMTFGHRVSVSLHNVARDMERTKYFWACDDLTFGYNASNDEEYEITKRHPRSLLPWMNEKAEFKDFCGALSLDGNIVFQLPMKQALPGPLFVIASANPEGTNVLIKIGKQIMISDEDGAQTIPEAGDFSQAIIWTYPDKIQKFDAGSPELQRALDSAGLKWR
jgi:hypothetical protein